jgi:hypothetical protein
MTIVPYVKDEEAGLARRMEEKLLALPKDAGVLFAGVSVEVTIAENPVYMNPGDQRPEMLPGPRSVSYHIWLGLDRSHDERLAGPLVQVVLREEVAAGAHLVVDAHRGVVHPRI